MSKSIFSLLSFCVVMSGAAAVPEIAENTVTFSEDASRVVTVSYRLTGAPAIVVFGVETNAGEGVWIKVDDAATRRAFGDVNRYVVDDKNTDKTFQWMPDEAWPFQKLDGSKVRIRVIACDPANPPDYMVVDLDATNDQHQAVRYYPSESALPRPITDRLYKTDRLVMRRVHATGIEWTQGSLAAQRKTGFELRQGIPPRKVVLTSDYYIGVYPVTQRQYYSLTKKNPSGFASDPDSIARPVENLGIENTHKCAVDYGNLLKASFGIDFGVPTEAQWEFACRAGTNGLHCDGSLVEADGDKFAWHKDNSGSRTHEVGTKEPNGWGLYDMCGNVWEVCQDLYVSSEDYAFWTQADAIDPLVTDGTYHVVRGGGWYCTLSQWSNCFGRQPTKTQGGWFGDSNQFGFRLSCPAVAAELQNVSVE